MEQHRKQRMTTVINLLDGLLWKIGFVDVVISKQMTGILIRFWQPYIYPGGYDQMAMFRDLTAPVLGASKPPGRNIIFVPAAKVRELHTWIADICIKKSWVCPWGTEAIAEDLQLKPQPPDKSQPVSPSNLGQVTHVEHLRNLVNLGKDAEDQLNKLTPPPYRFGPGASGVGTVKPLGAPGQPADQDSGNEATVKVVKPPKPAYRASEADSEFADWVYQLLWRLDIDNVCVTPYRLTLEIQCYDVDNAGSDLPANYNMLTKLLNRRVACTLNNECHTVHVPRTAWSTLEALLHAEHTAVVEKLQRQFQERTFDEDDE